MKNKKTFVKEVEDGSYIRYEINEDHSPILGKLSKIYKGFFARDPKEFRTAKDILYYKGGWPSANTPPRAKALADKLADAFMVLRFIGQDTELAEYLEARGLKLEFVEDESTFFRKNLLADLEWKGDKKREKLFKETWEELFAEKPLSDPEEVLTKIMDLASIKQKTICELADKIKIEKGGYVEEECDIKVSDYTKAVNLKYQKQKGKDIGDTLDKIEKDIEETTEVLDYFNDEDGFMKSEEDK